MSIARWLLLPSWGKTFVDRVLRTERDSLIGFWLQDERVGAVAADSSPESNDGAYSNVTLANGTLLKRPVPLYTPTDDSFLNVYSVGFAADFDPTEFTILIPIRVFNGAVWTNGLAHNFFVFAADATNYILGRKEVANNTLAFYQNGNGAFLGRTTAAYVTTDWLWCAVTRSESGNEFHAYINAESLGALAGTGAWAGALSNTQAVIGARTTAPIFEWLGWIGPCAVWNTVLTPAQIRYVTPN